MSGKVVGIDLGTTNSEVAVWMSDGVRVLEEEGTGVFPSVVGLDPSGRLLVGQDAKNQLVLYPDRTIRSVKRFMGTGEKIQMGERSFRPQEVSALILSALRERAERLLGEEVEGAVITVPAWFTDAQRQATREAGEIAGLTVHRIVNEPTAASLAYSGDGDAGLGGTFLVYDLGGGTFDVSIVRMEGGVNEVLASHGDTRLGGDDLDEIVLRRILEGLESDTAAAIRGDDRARARLLRAAEAARCRLSSAPFAKIREEAVVSLGGIPRHVEVEIARSDFEDWIHPLVSRTLESVHTALDAAKLAPRDLTGVLLVGGVTRTPLVRTILGEATGREPRSDLHPDLCVALGAGLLASRMSGEDEARVLVDITPWSFGIRVIGVVDGIETDECYSTVISKGTPLPASGEEVYFTNHDDQEVVQIDVYQGEERLTRDDVFIGGFLVEGLSLVPAGNEILVSLELDVSGILHVTAVERRTGLSKSIRIEGAVGRLGERELAKAKERFANLTGRTLSLPGPHDEAGSGVIEGVPAEVRSLVERYSRVRDRLHEDDRVEGDDLVETIRSAGSGRGKGSKKAIRKAREDLEDLLFYAGEGES